MSPLFLYVLINLILNIYIIFGDETKDEKCEINEIDFLRIPYDANIEDIDYKQLVDAVTNIGCFEVAIPSKMQLLLDELDDTLKTWFRSLDFGRNLTDPRLKYGYYDHSSDEIATQLQQFCIPWSLMDDSVNPFKKMKNVMIALNYMFHETSNVILKVWKRLNIYKMKDLYTILSGGTDINHDIMLCLSYYDPQILNMYNQTVKIGLNEHKDSSIITMVKSGGYGLEIKHKDKWFHIKDNQNKAFLINMGSAMEITTNGFMKAVRHRVIAVNQERLSLVFFLNAPYHGYLYKYNDDGTLKQFIPFLKHKQNVNKAIYGKKNAFNQ